MLYTLHTHTHAMHETNCLQIRLLSDGIHTYCMYDVCVNERQSRTHVTTNGRDSLRTPPEKIEKLVSQFAAKNVNQQ